MLKRLVTVLVLLAFTAPGHLTAAQEKTSGADVVKDPNPSIPELRQWMMDIQKK